jgi:hypothetical protein
MQGARFDVQSDAGKEGIGGDRQYTDHEAHEEGAAAWCIVQFARGVTGKQSQARQAVFPKGATVRTSRGDYR